MIQVLQYRYTSFQNDNAPLLPLLFLNTYMWLTIALIIGTSVLFLELLKFLQTYKSYLNNYTSLHIKRLYLGATEIELDLCFEFFALLPEKWNLLKSFLRKKNLLFKEKFQMLYWIMMSRQLLFLIQTRPPFLMSLRGSIYFHQRGQKMFPFKGLMTKGKLQRLLQFLLQVPFCLFS